MEVPEAEIVDRSSSGRGPLSLLRLIDLVHDGVESDMAFDAVPISIRDGLPKGRHLWGPFIALQ